MTKIVFVLGAGASVADVAAKSKKNRPPLDRGFFLTAKHAGDASGHPLTIGDVEVVREYVAATYGMDILSAEFDSLEGVMAKLYPDLFNQRLEEQAMTAFRALLSLFMRRLASTTNELHATRKRFLYRMISRSLSDGSLPGDITIVTFNQDLQVEKTLELMATARRWRDRAGQLFCFPHMYAIPSSVWASITGPRGSQGVGDLFPQGEPVAECLQVLKLHGSLNWYSTHRSSTPSRAAMFNAARRLSVTRRRTINPSMTVRGHNRSEYTLPVIVPPVTHKSSVLHEALGPVWALAEQRLIEADHVVVFGYSCPPLDFESANLLIRAQQGRARASRLSIVDPNPAIATRYIELLSPARVSYCADATAFLA